MSLQALIFDVDGTFANTEYTKTNNFERALVVIDHLGEEDNPFQIINETPSDYSMASLDYIKELYERNR